MSDSTILHKYIPGIQDLDNVIRDKFGTGFISGTTDNANGIHVIMSLLVTFFIFYLAFRYQSIRKKASDPLLPEANLNARSLVELICDAALGLMEGIMGKAVARDMLPMIGSMAFFILFCNLAGLIPGLLPPTEVISTNLALAGIVFFATHIYGLKKNGFEHIKHLGGPVWWLSPLMFPIEIVSHLARPLSLTLRLFGNMVGDHKVLTTFLGFTVLFNHAILVPLPVMVLGFIVCVVQALVFCLLSAVYIGMALEDLHDHH